MFWRSLHDLRAEGTTTYGRPGHPSAEASQPNRQRAWRPDIEQLGVGAHPRDPAGASDTVGLSLEFGAGASLTSRVAPRRSENDHKPRLFVVVRATAQATVIAASISQAASQKAVWIAGSGLQTDEDASPGPKHVEGLSDSYLQDQLGEHESPVGFTGLNRKVTCRVPSSCPILRATAVTHGYSWSAISFACKETA